MSDPNQVSTVHDAILIAREERQEVKEPYTLKVDPKLRDLATKVCIQNGTTLPAFLRGCLTALVSDYLPRK